MALTDDQVFRGTIIALTDLRNVDTDRANYDEFRSVAAAWVKEAHDRLT